MPKTGDARAMDLNIPLLSYIQGKLIILIILW